MNKSYESEVRIVGDTVVKTYKLVYYELNEQYERHGEQYWYKRLRSDFFLVPKMIEKDYIVLPYHGKVLGTTYKVGFRKGAKTDLISWLGALEGELNRLEVVHHDIHPGNILVTKEGIKLIDLSWMEHKGENKKLFEFMNSGYSTNDRKALWKIQRQIYYGKNKY